MIFLIPGMMSLFSTSASAFSHKSAPLPASTSLTRQAQQQPQHTAPLSQSLSSRSEQSAGVSERPKRRRKSALAFSPADIGGAATLYSP